MQRFESSSIGAVTRDGFDRDRSNPFGRCRWRRSRTFAFAREPPVLAVATGEEHFVAKPASRAGLSRRRGRRSLRRASRNVAVSKINSEIQRSRRRPACSAVKLRADAASRNPSGSKRGGAQDLESGLSESGYFHSSLYAHRPGGMCSARPYDSTTTYNNLDVRKQVPPHGGGSDPLGSELSLGHWRWSTHQKSSRTQTHRQARETRALPEAAVDHSP